jgi:hypothetical protein
MRIKTGIACGLLALVAGCSDSWKAFEPDRCRIGISTRQVDGSFRNGLKFRVKDDVLPTLAVQLEKTINKKWSVYTKIEGNQGCEKASPLQAYAEGDIKKGEIGVEHYFIRKNATNNFELSFGVGVGVGHAEFDMGGEVGPVYSSVHDSVLFWELNFGPAAEYWINDNTFIFAGARYAITDNRTGKCSADFDGLEGFAGIGWSW